MRRTSVLANAMFVLGPFVLTAIAVAATNPISATIAAATCYLLGMTLIVSSKLSLVRELASFSHASGTERLEERNRLRHFYGYGMIAIGIFFSLALLQMTT